MTIQFAGSPIAVGQPRHRRLLAALLLRPDTVVPSEKLAEMLWVEPPERATDLLYSQVAEVRRILRQVSGRPVTDLETHDAGYRLRVPDGALDRRRFEQLLAAGRRAAGTGDHRQAGERLHQALALWRGPAFADLADLAGRHGVGAETARLQQLRVSAIEARIEANLETGANHELIAELVALVAEHPLNERFWAQLMLARYRCGLVSDAVATYATARRELGDRLGVEPGPPLQRLHQDMLRQDPVLDQPPPASGPRVPRLPRPLTSFVGRETELAALHHARQTQRLVTVTGVGGVGKSRLVLESVTARTDGHPGPVWLVELAPLTQADLLADTVGDALGIPPHRTRPRIEIIQEQLCEVTGLLILDNCEHLVDAVADLTVALLDACPHLRILTTSRERLGIPGETLLPLPGLAVPDESRPVTAESVGRSPSVRLFVERANAVSPGFTLTDENASAVTASCQGLDGLPLAIELAAARANAFAVQEIAARLNNRFTLLTQTTRGTEPRHRTLHAVVDWSYRLLDTDQQRLFDRLSVFAGRFDLDQAERLAADLHPPHQVTSLVAALVDKSLLIRHDGHYRMLQTLRAYGIARLTEQGHLVDARDRHAAFVAGLIETSGHSNPYAAAWLHLLDTTMEEFRAAMEWTIARQDAQTALQIAGALSSYWHRRGQYSVGRRWLLLALDADGPSSPTVRAHALSGMAMLASIQGDLPVATTAGEEAAQIFQQLDDLRGYGLIQRRLATAEAFSGSFERAEVLLTRAEDAAERTQWPWLLGWVYVQRGLLAAFRQDWHRSAELGEAAQAVIEDVGDVEVLAYAQVLRADAARNLLGPTAGAHWARAALRSLERAGMRWSMSMALHCVSRVFGDLGQLRQEVIVLSAAQELRRTTGGAFFARLLQEEHERLEYLRRALGHHQYETAWRTGRTWSVSELVDNICERLSGEAIRSANSA